MAHYDNTRSAPLGAVAAQDAARGAGSVFAKIAAWYESYQTRRALSRLSDRELNDIGLSRSDINLF